MNCLVNIRFGLNEASREFDFKRCLRAWSVFARPPIVGRTNLNRPTRYLSLARLPIGAAVAEERPKDGEAGLAQSQSNGQSLNKVSKYRNNNECGRRGRTAVKFTPMRSGLDSLARELAGGTKFQGFEILTHESLPTPAAGLFPAGEDR
jgi:hypothetical protein